MKPCAGLDPNQVTDLVRLFAELVQQGSTIISIEHNLSFLRSMHQLIELGPGAGKSGGELVFQGTVAELLSCSESPTARALLAESSF